MNGGVLLYTIQRISQSSEGTFGTLLDPLGNILCYTCELPPCDNAPNQSCIPEGNYQCIPHNGEKWSNVWEISNVPGRSNILIHAGNTIKDSEGCVLVGSSEGWIGTQMAVLNSMQTLNNLRNTLPSRFLLAIIDSEVQSL